MRTRTLSAFAVLAVLPLLAAVLPGAPARAQTSCPQLEALQVPGAGEFVAVCLDDLTTLGNPRTDRGASSGAGTRESGSLHSKHTRLPQEPVPGVQIDGWFEHDSCDYYTAENNRFVPSCDDQRRHNGQFVIRIPNNWDGQHLVVGGTPGIRTQFASDIVLSDFVLTKGWAYASQDKGNTGLNFFRAGPDETNGSPATWVPPAALLQWASMMEATAIAAQSVLEQLHGAPSELTYAMGISNGGYQTRLALERYPELFDAGVDWEGTLFTAEGPNLYTYIPPILRNYPYYKGGNDEAYERLVHEGRLPPNSEPVWDHHYSVYYGTVQSIYRPAVDPEYTNYVAVPRTVVAPQEPDAQYDYAARPDFVKERVAQVSNTGDIHDAKLLTLHGTLDALLPISTDSDVYAQMVRDKGHDDDFRYYVVEGGTHVDTAADSTPEVFRPILPCFWAAIDALDAWVVEGREPPPNGFVPFPVDKTVEERANECGLPGRVERVAGPDRIQTAIRASRGAFGITETVVIATANDFPDALAAAPLAATFDSPVLLVGDDVSEPLQDELHRLGALEAVVVGGEAAVSADVVEQLQALGLAVRRLAGADRYDTAATVAREVDAESGEAIVASGTGFADALAIAPVAAAARAPILLSAPDALPDATAAALRDLSVTRTTVIGGRAAIADAVTAQLPSPTRIAGPDRYATSVAVARHALSRGHRLDEVYVATGTTFADALTAAPVATAGEWGAAPRGVVLLVDGRDAGRSQSTLDYLRTVGGQVERALVFGGEAAVSGAALDALAGALAAQ